MNRFHIILLLNLCLGTVAVLAQVAVIANKNVPLDSLSKAQLRDFYSCELKLWEKGLPVAVVDLKMPGEVKEAFYKFLGMTASRMKSLWLKKMLMGEGGEPLTVKSEEEMLKIVASTAGALGFVSLSKVTPEVKTLLVITSNEKAP